MKIIENSEIDKGLSKYSIDKLLKHRISFEQKKSIEIPLKIVQSFYLKYK